MLATLPLPGQTVGKIEGAANRVASMRSQLANAEQQRRKAAVRLSSTIDERFKVLESLQSERAWKIAELEEEKERTRKELIAGLFCSKCRRSKSRIERETKKLFSEHLTDVRGKQVSMSKEEILAIMLKYNEDIQALRMSYDNQIAEKGDLYRDRIKRYRSAFVMAEIHEFDSKYGLTKATQTFGSSVRNYQLATHKQDANWHASQQLKVARLGTQLKIVQHRRQAQIEAAKKVLSQAIADGDNPDTVNRREQALHQQLAARRQDSDVHRQKLERLDLQRGLEHNNRASRRQREEDRIGELVRETTGGSYRPLGIRTSAPWGYRARNEALAHAHQRDLDKLEAVRSSFDPDAPESDTEISSFAGAAKRRYQRMRRSAARLQRRIGDNADRALERARRARGAAAEALDDMRDYLRDKVLSHLPQATAEAINEKGWPNVSSKNLAKGTAMNWVVYTSQEEMTEAARSRLRTTSKTPADYYQKTLEVDFLDPNMGGAAWLNPFHGDATSRFWKQRISDPARDFLDLGGK